jgi:hypothetical protein
MKDKKIIRKIVIVICFFIVLSNLSACKSQQKDLSVTKWENIYEGNNIHFYYEDFKNLNIIELNQKYKLAEKVADAKDELEKANRLKGWIHEKMEFNKGSNTTKEDALNILTEVERVKKASDKDFAIVFSQAASSVGLYSRRGELKGKDEIKEIKNMTFKVCEIWSDTYNKWFMVDVSNGCYMEDNGVPLSAIEIIEKGLENVQIIGISNRKKYLKEMMPLFYSYSIEIDNNIYGTKKSNAYITYLKPGESPELKNKSGFIPPTIFVNKGELFGNSPKNNYIDNKSDNQPTIILMKKDIKQDLNGILTFSCGLFKNSTMVQTYYISVNNSPWTKVNKYTDVLFKEGINSIRISEDGINTLREIETNYKK